MNRLLAVVAVAALWVGAACDSDSGTDASDQNDLGDSVVDEEIPEPLPTEAPTPPQIVNGSGDSVLDLTYPQDISAIVHLTHAGSRNFAVISYDALGNRLDLLVNTIGSYDGTRVLNSAAQLSGVARLEIQADGPWTAEVKSIRDATHVAVPGRFDGVGDQVLWLDGTADTARFVGAGSSNFAVWSHTLSKELLVNEIAPYEGTVIVPPATLVVEVVATGPWSVDFAS